MIGVKILVLIEAELQGTQMKILLEFWTFFKERKKWWLFPMVVCLLLIGALIVLSSGSAMAPFIYTLF
jgi:hypothetical protein